MHVCAMCVCVWCMCVRYTVCMYKHVILTVHTVCCMRLCMCVCACAVTTERQYLLVSIWALHIPLCSTKYIHVSVKF